MLMLRGEPEHSSWCLNFSVKKIKQETFCFVHHCCGMVLTSVTASLVISQTTLHLLRWVILMLAPQTP